MGAGMGGATFRIEADGRFSWAASGCTFFSQEFGTLKRHGEELELIPITHPGMETSPFMTLPYRVIDWGNRRYLSRADGHRIEAFCRAALTPQRSSSFDVYLRESDRDKPQTGLPRLPGRIWLRYLAEELDPASEDGGLRLAIDSVRPKASR
jgi:hypothetical protein